MPYKNINVLWASIPCTSFSIAGTWKYFDKWKPTKEFKKWLKILEHTIFLISILKPNEWYIENPRGHMRKYIEDLFNKYSILRKRHTITYCQYWFEYMKPTDIWTNNNKWKPKKMCKNGDNCHLSAPRNSNKWLCWISWAYTRSKVPENLFREIL